MYVERISRIVLVNNIVVGITESNQSFERNRLDPTAALTAKGISLQELKYYK